MGDGEYGDEGEDRCMHDSTQGRCRRDLRVEARRLRLWVKLSVDMLNEKGTQDVEKKLEGTTFASLLVEDPKHLFAETISKGNRVEMKEGSIKETDVRVHTLRGLFSLSVSLASRTTFCRRFISAESTVRP